MASSIKLFTTGNMEITACYSASSEASGHPKELVYENNLDTYWKPTGATLERVDFDMSEAVWVNSVCVFLKNYKSYTAGNYKPYYSSNGSDWYAIAGQPSLIDINTPIRIHDWGNNWYKRYWRLWFQNSSHIPEVAAVWWTWKYTIDIGNVLPQEDEDQFHSRVSQLPGGRLSVAGINRNRVENFNRRYLIKSGDADFTDLCNTFEVSRGQRHPFVMNEGASQNDARVVRFADDILSRPTVGYDGLHEIEIGLRGIPYIDDGDSY